MDESTRKPYDAARTFSGKTFRSGCYAPFVSLYFNTLGDVLVCCKNETFVLGNVARQRLDEIWNGGKIRRLRQALVNYDFEQGCQVCEWQMTGGNHQGSLAWLFEEFPIDSAEPEWPAMIEFAVSNTCNFECIMCYGELSSLIRTHRDGLPPLPRFYSDEFFHDLRKYLPHLQRAKFLGGEPFLAQESLQIWNMMIEDGLSVPCHVTTNGSQYNSKVERVLEALPVSLSVSIDGVTKETVETIRLNCQYDTLIKNVYRFREYTRRRGTYMSLTYCLMRQNWHEFGEFLLFAEELGCEVFVNTVIDPPHCSLYKLPPASLAHIADEMEKRDSGLHSRLRLNRPLWEDTLRKLRSNASEHQSHTLTRVLKTYQYGLEEDHITAAKRCMDNGRYDEALKEILKTPEEDAYYYQALVLCGRIRHLLGDLDGAERDLDRALQISRRRPEALIAAARLRLDQNRLKDALDAALLARELVTEGSEYEREACEALSVIYQREGMISEAIEVLGRLRNGHAAHVRQAARQEEAWPDLRRVTPVSESWGFDRGLAVDRYYIEKFLRAHAVDIRGHVLEIEEPMYTTKFGGERVTATDVLHVVEGNPHATIVADLACADQIPSDTFDCIVLTQTLQLIYDTRAAIRTLHRILKPQGVLLATFPGITRISHTEWRGSWFWSFTTASARRLFEETFTAANLMVEAHGNVLVAIGFLHGLAAEDLKRDELETRDQNYEVLITLRAVKAHAS